MDKESAPPRAILGGKGEKAAEKYLRKNHYRILTRRFRTKSGEIDIIARQGPVLCFIEVKTRSDMAFGPPEEALTITKIKRISKAAQAYIQKKKLWDTPVRFDVVTVNYDSEKPEVTLIKGAFESGLKE